jgi:hypothetical protein
MPNILIGVPSYDRRLYVETSTSIMNTTIELLRRGAQVALFTLSGCALVTHARNVIVSEFLARKEKTHLLFIDADMEWSPATILRLIEANVPFSAAAYVKKSYTHKPPQNPKLNNLDAMHAASIGWNVMFDDADILAGKASLDKSRNGFAKVSHIGAGMMLLRRDMLETMVAKYRDTEYYSTTANDAETTPNLRYYGLFDTMKDEKGGLIGEDYAFCERWIKGCGGEIWCDVEAHIAHHGHHKYSGSLVNSLNLRAVRKS